ncbi:hypothetical protein P4T89_01485 [Bacillus nakamurai]|uniref:Uncharacterized protein n=1 Tax=Bacillus nakamurai TaxID=1793963 RepID=A0A150FBI5_9BACI|nr:hypothetical protein [Bacillus nakamurai]KXZ22667.1 hypothetical protein AXI58_07785 [Bacillus nakamurai]MED1226320.1 hypothetical protein [Bacillus nakamurai]
MVKGGLLLSAVRKQLQLVKQPFQYFCEGCFFCMSETLRDTGDFADRRAERVLKGQDLLSEIIRREIRGELGVQEIIGEC